MRWKAILRAHNSATGHPKATGWMTAESE